jgi:hypothetical protein
MNRLFNILKRKQEYKPPVPLPIEELVKYNIDPQERFDSVLINSKSGQELKEIYWRLSHKEVVENSEVLEVFSRFAKEQQSNCIAITELFLVTIAPLCYYRPELTEHLLYLPLQSFYWGTGSTDHNELKQFVKEHLTEHILTPYGGLPDAQGLKWLQEELPNLNHLTKQVFEQVVLDNENE